MTMSASAFSFTIEANALSISSGVRNSCRQDRQSESERRFLNRLDYGWNGGVIGYQKGDARRLGYDRVQEFQGFRSHVEAQVSHTGDVAAGARKTRHKPGSHRIGNANHDNRNRLRGLLGGAGSGSRPGDYDVGFQRDQFGGQAREALGSALRVSEIELDVLSLSEAKIAQTLFQFVDKISTVGRRTGCEPTDAMDFQRLLRERRQRRSNDPCGHSADEHPSIHH